MARAIKCTQWCGGDASESASCKHAAQLAPPFPSYMRDRGSNMESPVTSHTAPLAKTKEKGTQHTTRNAGTTPKDLHVAKRTPTEGARHPQCGPQRADARDAQAAAQRGEPAREALHALHAGLERCHVVYFQHHQPNVEVGARQPRSGGTPTGRHPAAGDHTLGGRDGEVDSRGSGLAGGGEIVMNEGDPVSCQPRRVLWRGGGWTPSRGGGGGGGKDKASTKETNLWSGHAASPPAGA